MASAIAQAPRSDQESQGRISSQDPASNVMGLGGFVVALLGIIGWGIVSPAAAVLSGLALRREPRGFAWAGLVLGVLGSIWLLLVGVGAIASAMGIDAHARTQQTQQRAGEAMQAIQNYVREHGRLPTPEVAASLLEGHADAWGHPLHYSVIGPHTFVVISAGPDGKPHTADDVHYDRKTMND